MSLRGEAKSDLAKPKQSHYYSIILLVTACLPAGRDRHVPLSGFRSR